MSHPDYQINATYVDRDRKQYQAHVMATHQYDAVRPGLKRSGKLKDAGEDVDPNDPVVSRCMIVGEGKDRKGIPCVDLMVNFGTNKQGVMWKYLSGVLSKDFITTGPNVKPKPYYIPTEDKKK